MSEITRGLLIGAIGFVVARVMRRGDWASNFFGSLASWGIIVVGALELLAYAFAWSNVFLLFVPWAMLIIALVIIVYAWYKLMGGKEIINDLKERLLKEN